MHISLESCLTLPALLVCFLSHNDYTDITADILDSLWPVHHHLLRDFSKPHHMLQEEGWGEEGVSRG